MLKASIDKKDKDFISYGLNDFVVSNGESHRMLISEVFVNESRVAEYRSDGLIVSTPTGSTAYSLSSGGPIIAPDVESFVITPISAHSLTSRPLVVSNKSEVLIKFSNYNQNITLITDGQLHESVDSIDTVSITNSNFEIGLIDFKDSDYFQTLRTKMGWGTRGDGESWKWDYFLANRFLITYPAMFGFSFNLLSEYSYQSGPYGTYTLTL